MPQPEAKILIREKNGSPEVELSFIDARTGRECRVGQKARGQADVDRQVVEMKETIERSGSRVSVRTVQPNER